VCQMETVLAVYRRASDPAYPVVRMDETSVQCARSVLLRNRASTLGAGPAHAGRVHWPTASFCASQRNTFGPQAAPNNSGVLPDSFSEPPIIPTIVPTRQGIGQRPRRRVPGYPGGSVGRRRWRCCR